MWIWQQQSWPEFSWDSDLIAPLLRRIYFKQGLLLGKVDAGQSQVLSLDAMLANIVHSSAIEGEELNAFSVRSSLATRLGVDQEQTCPVDQQSEGLADICLDAINNWNQPLTLQRILGWHQLLFPQGYTEFDPVKGGVLRGAVPMQVVSGRIDKPKLHFEAPPRDVLDLELKLFIDWFNRTRSEDEIDPIIRAAISHLWFVTLHPLDDGNGRITRLLTDLALAQAEHQSVRFYAMSVSILEHRKSYYEVLEQTQRGELNISQWIFWFLQTLDETLQYTLDNIEQVVAKTNFWRRIEQAQLTSEQVKVLNRLLDGDFEQGISSSQYQKVAKVSRATATRHLAQLVELKCIQKTAAGGRSTRYVVSS